MEQESILEEEVRKTDKFAKDFFYKVIDRLKKAGAPGKEYVIPPIKFVEQRTEAEEERYRELNSAIKFAIRSLSNDSAKKQPKRGKRKAGEINANLNPEQIKKKITEMLGYNIFEEKEQLEQKLSPKAEGAYDIEKKEIQVKKNIFENGNIYEVASHELLHAIRDQLIKHKEFTVYSVVNKKKIAKMVEEERYKECGEKIVYIKPEAMEFFSQMNYIVMESIFENTSEYIPNEKKKLQEISTLERLREAHKTIKNNVKERLEELLEVHLGIMSDIKKIIADKTAHHKPATSQYNERDVENLDKKYQYWQGLVKNIFKNADYLYIVADLPQQSIEKVQDGIQILVNAYKKEQLSEEIQKFSNYKKAREEFRAALTEAEIINILWERGRGHDIAKIAINEYKEELKENWPKVFLMPADEVERRYVLPVKKEIEKMQKNFI